MPRCLAHQARTLHYGWAAFATEKVGMERLDTTNIILVVLAVMSVLQTLVVLGAALGALRAYQTVARTLDAKLTPLLLRLEGMLINLEHTSAVVRTRTDDVSHAINSVQGTAGRLGAVMWPRAAMVAGVAGGVLGMVKRWRTTRRAQPTVTVIAG
jgi:hypothetical protein